MSEQTKQYRPLTGPEIIDYIVTEARKALEQSGQLPLHRAFHEMSFVGGIKISGWGTADAKVQFSGATNGGHPDEAVPVEIAVGIKAEAEPPSLVRERMAHIGEVIVDLDKIEPLQPNPEYEQPPQFVPLDPTVVPMAVVDVAPPSEIANDELPVTQDADGNFPCPNFGSGCDHVPFASKAAMISHRNNWCAVSGRRRQR